MVHHIRGRGFEDVQCPVIAAPKVGHQYLNLRGGREFAGFADAVYKVGGTAVAQVVTVHTGDHHVFQFQRGNGFGQIVGLLRIQRVRSSMAHIAKRASARAFVPHDHEGGGALTKTLANIGAAGFLAHRVQMVVPQNFFDLVKARGGRARLHPNPIGLFQSFGLLHLHRNTLQLGLSFLFDKGVVGRHMKGWVVGLG